MSRNRLRSALAEEPTAFGVWLTLASPVAAELCSWEEPDYICVDLQHGAGYLDALVPMLAAISYGRACPVVRVLSNNAAEIGKVLDAGAETVIVPMVNSRTDAERAVSACRYAPNGVRSNGAFRGTAFLNVAPHAAVNAEVICLAQIETVDALERLDEIAATPGLDGLYVGPSDLALSMGGSPGFHPLPVDHAGEVERIKQVAHDHGLLAGMHCYDAPQARNYGEEGFDLVTVSSDAAMLRKALHEYLRIARQANERTRSNRPIETGGQTPPEFP
jgi:4-hydroxy-2-oxoheptanedioate aldolase